jgi:hypothetical protein
VFLLLKVYHNNLKTENCKLCMAQRRICGLCQKLKGKFIVFYHNLINNVMSMDKWVSIIIGST